jgi:nucleoside-diphosphate-sugar epimerase
MVKVRKTEEIVRAAKAMPDYCIVRPTSIWGPHFKEPYKNFFDMVLVNRFLHPGVSAAVKTYGYVENSVNQLISLMLTDENHKASLIYLGDEPALNISTWANQIANLAGLREPPVVPLYVFKVLAYLGDSLKLLGVSFPMTSFRLSNMTTNNVLDCSMLGRLNQFDSVSTKVGIIQTLKWIDNKEELR